MGSGVLPKAMLFRSVVMAHTTSPAPTPLHATSQEVAIHMIASAARILLMLGTAILIGEVAAGPAKKLLESRARHRLSVNEDGEPAD